MRCLFCAFKNAAHASHRHCYVPDDAAVTGYAHAAAPSCHVVREEREERFSRRRCPLPAPPAAMPLPSLARASSPRRFQRDGVSRRFTIRFATPRFTDAFRPPGYSRQERVRRYSPMLMSFHYAQRHMLSAPCPFATPRPLMPAANEVQTAALRAPSSQGTPALPVTRDTPRNMPPHHVAAARALRA